MARPVFDAVSESHTGTTGSASEASFTWQHNPVGTPRGVLVFTFVNAFADDATGVTYDGIAMTAVSGGRAELSSAESGDCKAWYLGASILTTDPADVVVTRNNNANVMYAVCITLTATADTEVVGTPVLVQAVQAPAEVAVDSSTADALRFAGINYGGPALAPAGASSTAMIGIDFGPRTINSVRETTGGTGSRSVGFAAGSDDDAAVHLAIAEVSGTFVTPAVIAVTVAVLTPTILAVAVVAQTTVAATASLPLATVKGAAIVQPTVIAAVAALPTPTILAAAKTTPAVVAVTLALPTPAILAVSTVTPAVLAAVTSLPTPAVLSAATVTPTTLVVVVALPTPTIDVGGASATVNPAVIAAVVALPTPATLTEATVAPAVIAALTALPTASVLHAAVVAPNVIVVLVALPGPVGSSGPRGVRDPINYTLNPVGYVPVRGGDTPPPW